MPAQSRDKGFVARLDAMKALERLRFDNAALPVLVDDLVKRLDATEPVVAAYVPEPDRAPRLRSAAAALAGRWPDPRTRPPLYGLLLGVKDIFHVEGMPTQAGSALPPALFAGPQAGVVTALRSAGALVVGKTVTAEFAHAEPGPTRNPHNPQHTPGGSSSGSAAAVAAGTAMVAIGSQTIGSVIRPAAYCGIIGLKPSYGRIPADGVVSYSRSVDHVGLFAQDVATMTAAAATCCTAWRQADYEAAAGRRPVIGLVAGPYLSQAEPEAITAFAYQAGRLAAAGYTIFPVETLTDIAEVNRRHALLIRAELADVHSPWFASQESLYRPRTAQAIREGLRISATDAARAREGTAILRNRLHAEMTAAGIDLWASPAATGPAPVGIESTGNSIMNLPWTHAGLPTITLPAGRADNGLPLGLQLSARFDHDEPLLCWASDIAAVLSEEEAGPCS